jgi:two-component system, NarL family, response regulator LiaR
MSGNIRLLIADDHSVVRYGVSALMETVPDVTVVGAAADGVEVVELAQTLRPDVILLDLLMPRQNGMDAIRELKTSNPEARLLVLTSFVDDDKLLAAMRAGAEGYVLKDSPPQVLVQAIHAVYHGEAFLPPGMARKLQAETDLSLADAAPVSSSGSPLTGREMNVMHLLAKGLSNQEIAERLRLSERTVGLYVSSILKKLQVANRTQAALHALRQGWVGLE